MNKTIEAVSSLLESNLDFRAKVSIDEATEILKRFRPYNFIPEKISELPQAVAKAIGPVDFGGDNPNNGKFANLNFYIGNEGSLVIYIRSDMFYQPMDHASNANRQASELHRLGEIFSADEIDVDLENGARIVNARLWWD